MFLAEAIIPYETASKREFHTPWDWHAALWQCFPGPDSRPSLEEQPFLSRFDQLETGQRVILLSMTEPTRPDWCPEPGWRCREVPDSFFDHERYRFSLIANPTVTRRDESKPVIRREDGTILKNRNSKRVPIQDPAQQCDWLRRQASRRGFEIIGNIDPVPLRSQHFSKRSSKDKKSHNIRLHRVRFEGILCITDKELFRREWPKGIGRGRAFGNGFLLIHPQPATP